MADEHYPDENYGAGVPDLSGLDFAVDMMRNAPAKLDLHERLDAAAARIAEMEESLRQAKITEGGLRRTLDGVQQRAQHTQKTNRDLIGRNERLKTRIDVLEAATEKSEQHAKDQAVSYAHAVAVIEKLVRTVRENHEWHVTYEDHGTYSGSDLCVSNEAALTVWEK